MSIDEKTQQLFEQYKTNLESKFAVPLSDVKLRVLNRDFLSELTDNDKSDPTSITGRAMRIPMGMAYYVGLNIVGKLASGCAFNYYPTKQKYVLLTKEPCKLRNPSLLPIILVHELSHVIAHKIWDRGPKRLNPFIQEGFAEYVSLRMHKESYGNIEKIADIIDSRIKHHNSAISNKQPKTLRKRIDDFMFNFMLKILSGRSMETYSIGFLFFDELCSNHGFNPQDILKNPPAFYGEIAKPELYAKRRRLISPIDF